MLDFHNDRVVDECSLAKKEFVMTPSGMSRQGCRTSSCAHRSCQQEADAAHPAPARGRGKRNAGESGMPAGSGSCPSGASLGAVGAKCEQEAEAGKQEVPSDCDLDDIPSSAVPSDHSSAVPSDDGTPASSAVPSDHDSDVSIDIMVIIIIITFFIPS